MSAVLAERLSTPVSYRCPECGALLGAPSLGAPPAEIESSIDVQRDLQAEARLSPKLAALVEVIDDLSEEAFAAWLHDLPEDEFLAFIVLDENAVARLLHAQSACDREISLHPIRQESPK